MYARFDVRASISKDTEDITNRKPTILTPLSLPSIDDRNINSSDEDSPSDEGTPIQDTVPIFNSSLVPVRSHDPTDMTKSHDSNKRSLKRKDRKNRKLQKLIDTRLQESEKRQANIKKMTKGLGPYWNHPPDVWTPEDDILENQGLEKQRLHNKRSIKLNKKYNQDKIAPIIGRRPTRNQRIAIAQAALIDSDMPPTPNSLEDALRDPDADKWRQAILNEKIDRTR
jgi:hypothetical protein